MGIFLLAVFTFNFILVGREEWFAIMLFTGFLLIIFEIRNLKDK